MPEPASAQTPLAIDRVEHARGQGDRVRLRVSGRWLTTRSGGVASTDIADLDALLVVQIHGQRHRFPATRERRDAPGGGEAGAWAATFTVPDWAVPEQPGQASLWVGSAVVAVPPPGTPLQSLEPPPAPAAPVPGAGDPPPAAPPPRPPPLVEREALAGEYGRSGPLADLLFKETVSALHAELEQRSAEAARLRGALAEARSDVQTRAGTQSGLEATHAELRDELQRLMAAVAQQRTEFDERLAALAAERDGARAELESARAELESAGAELESAGAKLESTRAEFDRRAVEARAEAEAEVAAARAEADQRLAELAGARDERVAQAAALRDRISSLMASERRWAEEAAAVREQLASAQIARDGALSEATGLRGELDRLGSELAVSREQSGAAGGDLSEAQRLLADARALTEQLRGRPGP